jgi:DNA-binding XRE family transcriptional regulator
VALPICQIVLKAQKPLKKLFPDVLITIGDHIKKKRAELKLTQKQVAELLIVTECTIWNWENNYTQPTVHCLAKVIQFLGYIP